MLLNNAAQADILWWHLFMEKWNGISMLWDTQRYLSDITVYSDASGSWGCGALWQQKWFNFPWSAKLQTCSIAVKQLVPVVVTACYVVHRAKAHSLLKNDLPGHTTLIAN